MVKPGRQPQKPGYGTEGQLQTDGCGRKGILQQDTPQCCCHSGGRIIVPPEQGRKTQKREHDAGPDYRGAPAGHQCVECQRRNGYQSTQPTAAEHDHVQKESQKAAVHAGDGKNMVDPGLGKIGLDLRRKRRLVSCQNAAQQRGGISGKQTGDTVHQGVPGPNRPPADGSGSAAGDPGRLCAFPCFIGQQKNALGGECGHIFIVDRCRAFQRDGRLHALAGRELQQIRSTIEHQLSGEPVCQNGDLGTVIGRLGIIRQGQCDPAAAEGSGTVFHGTLDLADIQPVPSQSDAKAHPHKQDPAPHAAGKAMHEHRCCQKEHQGGRDLPGDRQEVLTKKDPTGKCSGKYGQRSHLPGGGVGSSVRPSR